MIVENVPVKTWVRVAANLSVASVLAGSTAYISWLIGIPQWAALVFGVLVLIGYGLMWAGSFEDNRNA